MSAASGSFTGDVTANTLTANNSGSIAGWNITSGGMTNETNEHIVTFCNGTNDNKDVLVIYDKASKTWPFFVRANGYVYASNHTYFWGQHFRW